MQSCAFEFSLASSLLFGRSLLQLNPCPLSYVGIFLNQVQELHFNQSDRSSYPSMQARHASNGSEVQIRPHTFSRSLAYKPPLSS
jgi:hypothetical protein